MMPIRADQKIDAGVLDGLPVGQAPAEGEPDTRLRSRPLKNKHADGARFQVDQLDDDRWQVTIVKPAGTVQHTGDKESVLARCAADADARDLAAIRAAINGA